MLIKRVHRALFFLALSFLSACGESAMKTPSLVHWAGETMGTTYSIKIIALPDEQQAMIRAGIEKRIHSVNANMSTYLSDSEVSKFNRSKVGEWYPLSRATLDVIALSLDISKQSSGAFDITVGPLIELWGFGTKDTANTPPTQEVVDQARSQVGYQALQIHNTELMIQKKKAVTIDLSAIAKGYAVDVVADYLDSQKIQRYLVEIGGEMRVRGFSPRNTPWRIGVEKPVSERRIPQRAINLTGSAIATSGDYRNYYEVDGQRYSHTINPATGYPARHQLASVTVVHASAALADAWATALNVLGPVVGFKLAQSQHLAAYFIVRSTEGFTEQLTDSFSVLLSSANESPSGE